MTEQHSAWGQLLAWHGDNLLVADDAALKKVDRKYMSASTTKSMQGCPARFVADKLSDHEPDPMAANEIGSDAHTVHERLFGDRPMRRTLKRAVQHIVDLGYEKWAEDQEVERALWQQAVMDKLLPIFKIEDPATINVIGIEESLMGVRFGDVPLAGYIDRVDRLDDDTIRIVDLKTGRPTTAADVKRWGHDEEGDQLRVYAAAYEQKHGVRPKAAVLHYTANGKARKVPVTGPQVRRSVDALRTAWYELKDYVAEATFPTRPSPLCGWCPLVNACPSAQRDGKEARIPAPEATFLGIPQVGPVAATLPVVDDPPEPPEEEPGQWREQDRPAHTDIDRVIERAVEEYDMGSYGWSRSEGKPWEAKNTDTRLDPASNEAIAVIGLVEMAVETLHAAEQRVTPATVRALTSTLAAVVMDTQEQVFGHRDWGRSSNTRARGALHTVLATMPIPFGEGAGAIADWQTAAVRRMTAILTVALDLYFDNLDARADLAAA